MVTPADIEQSWLEERRRRLHLVKVLNAVQFEMYGVRHLPMGGEAGALWTVCIKLVEDAILADGAHDKTPRRT